jgi:Flp pilus assembly protein TadG
MRTSYLKNLPKKSFTRLVKGEEGSAIIEFIVYALPLFVPLVIYLTAINQSSEIQYEARNFARQMARAYVTSPSQDLTEARMFSVLEVFVKNTFASNKIDPHPKIEVSCTLSPCLSPNGKVEVKVSLTSILTGKSASATAVQTVDAWRNS